MTNQEFAMIKTIIDIDTKQLNIKDLKKIKKYLKDAIKKCNNEINNNEINKYSFDISKGMIKDKSELLLMSVEEYFESNTLIKNKLIRGLLRRYDYHYRTNVKLYDLVRLTKRELSELFGIGNKTVKEVQEILNKDGLSLDIKLTDEQIKLLEKSCSDANMLNKDELNKKMEILSMNFLIFWKNSIGKEDKRRYHYYQLAQDTLLNIPQRGNKTISEITVYDVFLHAQRYRVYLDTMTGMKFEELLNKYNLSLKKELSIEQINELENKKVLIK